MFRRDPKSVHTNEHRSADCTRNMWGETVAEPSFRVLAPSFFEWRLTVVRVVSGSSARFCLGFFLRRQQTLADDGLFVVNEFPDFHHEYLWHWVIRVGDRAASSPGAEGGLYMDFGTAWSPRMDPGSYKHPQSATSVGGVKLLRQGEARVWTRLTSQSGLCDSTSASNESAERQLEGEQRGLFQLFSESFVLSLGYYSPRVDGSTSYSWLPQLQLSFGVDVECHSSSSSTWTRFFSLT